MNKRRMLCLLGCSLMLTGFQLSAVSEEEVLNSSTDIVQTNEKRESGEGKGYLSAGNEATLESKIEFLNACKCGHGDQEENEEGYRDNNRETNSAISSIKRALGTSVRHGSSINRGYFTTHPGVNLYPLLVGDEVQLDDLSVWRIEPSQAYLTLNWSTIDQVVIRANFSLWGSYQYLLENLSRGIVVEANLLRYMDPIYHGVKNYTIIDIDPIQCLIWLSDNSVWSVDWWNFTSRWKRGHTVIIGINDGIDKATMPNILINANLITHLRASCIR